MSTNESTEIADRYKFRQKSTLLALSYLVVTFLGTMIALVQGVDLSNVNASHLAVAGLGALFGATTVRAIYDAIFF